MTKKKVVIITECKSSQFSVTESQTSVPDGCMRISGIVAVTDVKNDNGRIYPKTEYQRHVDNMMGRIMEGVYGEYEHPDRMDIDWNRMTHKVEKVWIQEDGTVMADFLLLDTPLGLIAQSIAKTGGTIKASSRAVGTIDGRGVVSLDEMATYDLVRIPGFSQTSMKVSESKCINESRGVNESGIEVMIEKVYYLNENHSEVTHNFTDSAEFQKMVDGLLEAKIAKINESGKQKIDAGGVAKLVTEQLGTLIESKIQLLEKRIQNRIVEACGTTAKTIEDKINEGVSLEAIKTLLIDQHAPVLEEYIRKDVLFPAIQGMQSWVMKDYTPKLISSIESYLNEGQDAFASKTFVKENILKFAEITEGFIGDVTSLVDTHLNEGFAPNETTVTKDDLINLTEGIQNWFIKDVSPMIDAQIAESAGIDPNKPDTKKVVVPNVNINLTESTIREVNRLMGGVNEEIKKAMNNVELLPYLKFIPEAFKVVYQTLPYEIKETLAKRAHTRNIVTEEQAHQFWSVQDFPKMVSEAKQKAFIKQ